MANIPVQSNAQNQVSSAPGVNYKPALMTMAVLYLMMGFITCLNDTLVPFFKKGFELSYAQSSLVQFYFFLTYGLMSIPAGKIVGKIGYKNGIVAGFAVAAVGAFMFFPAAILHVYGLFLAALFILAIGIVLLQVAANPYITALGAPSTASSRLSLIQGMGSIGTTIAPLFGAWIILSKVSDDMDSSKAVIGPYLGIAGVLLLVAIIIWRLKLPVINSAHQVSNAQKGGILKHLNLRYGIIALFCYVGAEVAIGTFLTNYIADSLHIAEVAANTYVAIYWGSMFVGRLLGAVILKYIQAQGVLIAAGGLAILLIIISLSSSGELAAYSMVAVGFCNSVMFAIIFSLAVKGLGHQTTQASGLLSSAIVGGSIISYSQGVLIDHFNWSIAFLIPLACYIIVLVYGILEYRRK